jgi:hypothetical protein
LVPTAFGWALPEPPVVPEVLDAAELKLDLDPAPAPVPILLVDVAPFGDAFLYGDLVLLDTPGP